MRGIVRRTGARRFSRVAGGGVHECVAGAVRGAGWGHTANSQRGLRRFFMSVVVADLEAKDEAGIAFTLTVRDCPPSPREWVALWRALVERFRRKGAVRWVAVVEWQTAVYDTGTGQRVKRTAAKGRTVREATVPHLHGVVWFASGEARGLAEWVVVAWLWVSRDFGSDAKGQHAVALRDAGGWFGYLSGHLAKGLDHYQRRAENVPAAWRAELAEGRGFRPWYRGGDWPTGEGERFGLDDDAGYYYALRRRVRNLAEVRARYRLRKAKGRLVEARAAAVADRSASGGERDAGELRRAEAAERQARKGVVSARRMLSRSRGGDAAEARQVSAVRGVSFEGDVGEWLLRGLVGGESVDEWPERSARERRLWTLRGRRLDRELGAGGVQVGV